MKPQEGSSAWCRARAVRGKRLAARGASVLPAGVVLALLMGSFPAVQAEESAPAAATTSPVSTSGSETPSPEISSYPVRHRLAIQGGGGAWQHNFGIVTLTGYAGRGGLSYARVQGPLRYVAVLEGLAIIQNVGGQPLESTVVGGSGVGVREAYLGALTVGAGYQWLDPKVRPFLIGRAGVGAGIDNTRIEVAVQTETTTIAGNVFWGYDLDQAFVHQGLVVSPAVNAEFGIEPFRGERQSLELSLEGVYLPRNKTFAVGLNLRLNLLK